ncbi:OmpA/MotB family protein [Holophaga foetida]|uniref:OmpA/MotB family protein n=1 Tax=Holophaga foetida TaxID=35839 RepID=UPI00130EC94D|nr:OmpA family protein [Holophaga foetida]
MLILLFMALKMKDQIQAQKSRQSLESTLEKILQDIKTSPSRDEVAVDVKGHRIQLKDAVFESRSACLSPKFQVIIRQIGEQLLTQIQGNKKIQLLVEGHTDSSPLTQVYATPCGAFNDNYSLSAARAASARRELLAQWPEDSWGRVGIAGYGPDRPVNPENPKDGSNRRVEIRIEFSPDGR